MKMLAITECCQALSLQAAPAIFQHSETIYRSAGALFGCDLLRFYATADDTPRTLSKDALPEQFGVIGDSSTLADIPLVIRLHSLEHYPRLHKSERGTLRQSGLIAFSVPVRGTGWVKNVLHSSRNSDRNNSVETMPEV
jgi:hypothetical protein